MIMMIMMMRMPMMIIRMFNEVDYEGDEGFDEEEKEKNLERFKGDNLCY